MAERAMTTTATPTARHHTPVITTLYELIAALNEEVAAGEEDVVTAAVVHLCQTGRLRFLDDPRQIEIDGAGESLNEKGYSDSSLA